MACNSISKALCLEKSSAYSGGGGRRQMDTEGTEKTVEAQRYRFGVHETDNKQWLKL